MKVIKKIFRYIYERNWLRFLIIFILCSSLTLIGILLAFFVNYLYLIFAVVGAGLWIFMVSAGSYKKYKQQHGLINKFEDYLYEKRYIRNQKKKRKVENKNE